MPADAVPARRLIPAMLMAGIIGLGLGYAVLELVNAGIGLVWETIPSNWSTTPAWYIIGVLVVAAVVVYVVRTSIGDAGHSPLQGIAVSGLTPQEYLGAILAIGASLIGGIVLGPEVALVATGSVVGTLAAKWMGISDAKSVKKVVGLGALGAILALFVGPLVAGTLSLDDPKQSIEVDQLAWAVVVAVIATIAITLARVGAAFIAQWTGGRANLVILVGSALVVAISAIAMQSLTGESVLYVVTSSEALITDLPTLTSASTVITIIILKTIAYAVSMGAGFRGGPFFPAMFIGAASGLFIALVLPSGPSVQAALVVGVVASVIATAKMKWPLAIALGIVIGFVMGTWTLIPAAVIGAVVARAVPRWGDWVASKLPVPASA